MHLAYLDDSDTKAKTQKWQVMSGVLIEDNAFKLAEAGMSGIPENLISPDKIDKFEEFHACELYGGYGVFAGIEQSVRFAAIERLLVLIRVLGVKIVYGAVNLDRLKKELFASADPLDICFRVCLLGIEHFSRARLDLKLEEEGESIESDKFHQIVFRNFIDDLVILILDECDGKAKSTLIRSFRAIRPPTLVGGFKGHTLHDDMYFGDSRYSVGIQLADLCSYFIARHLEGDVETEEFFDMIEPNIIFSQSYPEPVPSVEEALEDWNRIDSAEALKSTPEENQLGDGTEQL